MDTLTHALSGALAARATARPHSRLDLRERTLAGFLAAGFPDADYALFWVAPLEFLNWHRGPTHSLLLLPLWALLLAAAAAWLAGDRRRWRAFYGVCALGLGVHIAGDLVTLYGTKLLYPLSDAPVSLDLVFDLDPYIAAIVALGFAASLIGSPRRAAVLTCMALAGYLVLQAALQGRTVAEGERWAAREGLAGSEVRAYPQPFAPVFWNVVVADGERYLVAHVNRLAREASEAPQDAGFLRRLFAAYRPADALEWTRYSRFGEGEADSALAREAWGEARMAPFRRFVQLPALYRIDRGEREVCVWFTDLRHLFPTLPPTFRYGVCRTTGETDWRLYRLRYYSHDERQLLG